MRSVLAIMCFGALAVFAAPASAQAPPVAAPVVNQHCTGVLCDAYYAVHPNGDTQLPCRDFICGMFGGGRTAEAPAPQQLAVSEPAPMPAPHKVHRKHAKSAAKASKAVGGDTAAQ